MTTATITWEPVERREIQVGDLVRVPDTRMEGLVTGFGIFNVHLDTAEGRKSPSALDYKFERATGTWHVVTDFRDLEVGDFIVAYSTSGGITEQGTIARLSAPYSSDHICFEGRQGGVLFSMRKIFRRAQVTPPVTPTVQRPEVGARFTRHWENSRNPRVNCTVNEVQDIEGGWQITYSSPSMGVGSKIRLMYDGTVYGGTAGLSNKGSITWESTQVIPDASWAKAAEPVRLYPTVHHLKAALYDLLQAQVDTDVWCESGVTKYARQTGLSLGSKEQDRAQVDALITQLQKVSPSAWGITQESFDKALRDLGISGPVTKNVTISIEVPVDIDPVNLSHYLRSTNNLKYTVKEQI